MALVVTVHRCPCFTGRGIPWVRRTDCIVFDRGTLPYLNAIEKFNGCAQGNGVTEFLREFIVRGEQYGRPIGHARRLLVPQAAGPWLAGTIGRWARNASSA